MLNKFFFLNIRHQMVSCRLWGDYTEIIKRHSSCNGYHHHQSHPPMFSSQVRTNIQIKPAHPDSTCTASSNHTCTASSHQHILIPSIHSDHTYTLLYTVPMNINMYVPFLINTLDTIVRWVMYWLSSHH